VKRYALFLSFLTLLASLTLTAQSTSSSPDPSAPASNAGSNPGNSGLSTKGTRKVNPPLRPFSRLALSGGVSAMGINVQAATNMNRYLNLRATGNYLNYSLNNITVNGLNVVGKLNFAAAGAGVDLYPFPNHGFRLSPGVMFHNENAVSADVAVPGGKKLSLNDVDYYASSTNPITGTGSVGLHTQNPAFTMTTGWGNVIPRNGGHWSFPFEIGAGFVGTPLVNVSLTKGQACDVNGLNCVNVATDPTVNANLKAQVDTYKKDLDSLRYYPIISFGIAYNFSIR
jgi:hypothetical protein